VSGESTVAISATGYTLRFPVTVIVGTEDNIALPGEGIHIGYVSLGRAVLAGWDVSVANRYG
jgi:hypothetical protein